MRLTRILCSQYFKRYIEKNIDEAQKIKRTWKPVRGWVEDRRKTILYDENRPWTEEFKRNNDGVTRHRRIPVEPVKEFSILKGDVVEILVGKDKGKQGIINCIIKERNWCFVEGLNTEYKVQRTQSGQPPRCYKDERPLLITSQVKLIDPSDRRTTDIDWRYTEDGERVRVSKRTGRIVPIPESSKTADDGIVASNYTDNVWVDTKAEDVTTVTFKPKLKSFEEDVCEEMGIPYEERKRKTYWY